MSVQNKKPVFTPEVGDIFFTSSKSSISWLLRFLLGPFKYSHLCIAGEDVDGQSTVYTTGLGGGFGVHGRQGAPRFLRAIRYRQLYAGDYLAGKTYVVCRYKNGAKEGLTTQQKEDILQWCHSQLGNKYPLKKTFKFFKMLLRANGIDAVRLPGQDDLYVCYEAVARAYLQIGIDLSPRAGHKDPSGYDAKEIYLSPFLTNVFTSTARHK